jgi:hypothetical protein
MECLTSVATIEEAETLFDQYIEDGATALEWERLALWYKTESDLWRQRNT